MDYSKWDKIELSDDSDIEEHPNIDKGSMIRWRQAKIHRDRRDRRDKIESTKREIELNKKAYALLSQCPFGKDKKEASAGKLQTKDDVIKVLSVLAFTFGAAETEFKEQFEEMRFSDWNERWGPPSLLEFVEQRIRYVEWVRKQLERLGVEDEARAQPTEASAPGEEQRVPEKSSDFGIWKEKTPEELLALLQKETAELLRSIMQRNEVCVKDIEREEKESRKKLTSENIGTVTVDSTKVSKTLPKESATTHAKIETIHDPSASVKKPQEAPVSTEPKVAGDFTTLPKVEEFSKLSSLEDSAEFVRRNMFLIHSDYNSGLLSLAFRAEMKGELQRAKQCIHQATIINYCKEMGAQNTPMFFKRLLTNREALLVFMNDVNDTYARLHSRVQALKEKEQKEELEEQQLNQARLELATQEDGSILWPIVEGQNDNPAELEKKAVFDKLPPAFKKALILQDVDGINQHLSSLSKPDLEKTVSECSKVGIIQVQDEE